MRPRPPESRVKSEGAAGRRSARRASQGETACEGGVVALRGAQKSRQDAQDPGRAEPAAGRPGRRAQELVAEEGLVGALARQHRAVAGFAHSPAEEVARRAVGVELKGLGVPDGVGEVVGQIGVAEHDDGVVGVCGRGRFARPRALVEFAPLEPDREGGHGAVGAGGCDSQDGGGIEAAADQATDGDPRDHAQPDRFLGEFAGLVDGLGEAGDGRCGCGPREPGVGVRGPGAWGLPPPRRPRQIPVPLQPHRPFPGPHHVPRRHLSNPAKQRPPLIRTRKQPLVHPALVPRARHPRREKRLRLRREVERAVVLRVEERLEAEAVARREQRTGLLVPDHEGELAAQVLQAARAVVLVEVERDLAVGAGAEAVSLRFELGADALEVVELAVDDDVQPTVLARDRLVALGVVDHQQRVAQSDPAARGNPGALRVRPTMPQGTGGAAESCRVDGSVTGQDRCNTAHRRPLFLLRVMHDGATTPAGEAHHRPPLAPG